MRTAIPELARPHAELMPAIDSRKGIPARQRARAADDVQKLRLCEHLGIQPEQLSRCRIRMQHPGRLQRPGGKPCIEIRRQPCERIGDGQLAESPDGGHQVDSLAALARFACLACFSCFNARFAACFAGRTYKIAQTKNVTDSRISTQASALEKPGGSDMARTTPSIR